MKFSKKVAELILTWIINEVGYKKERPQIFWSKNKKSIIYGQQQDNWIRIFEFAHDDNFEEFVDTVLHEFRHIMQMNSKTYYPKLKKAYYPSPGLKTEDIEMDAELFAKKYKRKFLNIFK